MNQKEKLKIVEEFKFKCPAKINLYLKITGKRPDGFHELESLFAFLDLFDELEVKTSDKLQIDVDGEFFSLLDPKNNLFTQILDFFVDEFDISRNLQIKITKNIPIGGGLGGGSSNASYFIKALNEIFVLNLTKEEMQKISLKFGSDIAFFFEEQASIVKGRGEIIENFGDFKAIPALLINPKIHISTKEIFQKFDGNFSEKIDTKEILQKDVLEMTKIFKNDLEKPAIETDRKILEVINKLKNNKAKIAKMSGSGATCFGIFDSELELKNAAKNISNNHPDFFVKEVKILSHV